MKEPCAAVAAFYDCLVRIGCSHCDIINQMQQIRHTGYRNAVALLSPIVQITADMPISDINIGLTLTKTSHNKSVI